VKCRVRLRGASEGSAPRRRQPARGDAWPPAGPSQFYRGAGKEPEANNKGWSSKGRPPKQGPMCRGPGWSPPAAIIPWWCTLTGP